MKKYTILFNFNLFSLFFPFGPFCLATLFKLAQKKENKFLILLTDFFGLSFNNNKILADKIAEQGYTGLFSFSLLICILLTFFFAAIVYVPDILQGDDVPSDYVPNLTGTVWNKMHFLGKLVTLVIKER